MTTWTNADASDPRLEPARQAAGPRASLMDVRGLTAAGAACLVVVLSAVGAVVDRVTGTALGTGFAVCFVLGCGLAAIRAHREDLLATVVMAPLVYLAMMVFAGILFGASGSGGALSRQALEVASLLILDAPVLLIGTALALAIAVVRGRRQHPSRPRYEPRRPPPLPRAGTREGQQRPDPGRRPAQP